MQRVEQREKGRWLPAKERADGRDKEGSGVDRKRKAKCAHGCIGTTGMHLWHGSWPREKRAHTTIIRLGKKNKKKRMTTTTNATTTTTAAKKKRRRGLTQGSPALPVTCTSRVCLPASRSGSYLHSADEAATVALVFLPPVCVTRRLLLDTRQASTGRSREGCGENSGSYRARETPDWWSQF